MVSSPGLMSEKPKNGIAGLKHLRHDILSGIVVSLVSLPLSSGIAIASGAPPVYGLISAIIAGLLFPLIGGAYVTISGPAAGLAPALFAITLALGGHGDAEHVGQGYPLLLVVIFMVGCLQIVLSLFKLARFAAVIPVAVVEGMLASIGLLIIVKQLPMFFGYLGEVHAHEFFEFIAESPRYAAHMTTNVFTVSGCSLVLLFVLGAMAKKVKFLQIIPPQLVAVVVGSVLGYFMNLGSLHDGLFLIRLPKNPFHGIHPPHFGAMLNSPELWYAAAIGVVTLTMIDGVESLATAMAVDRIDPFRRKSEPNRLLLAMGISNIASSMVGGLTIIPGGVKSKVNIASGGRTLWANFTNAICLIIYLLVAQQWINMIPKGVLGAVLIYTGWKMCEPVIWRHMAHVGVEQLGLFSLTVLATLLTDLLWGIGVGVFAKFAINVLFCQQAVTASASRGDTPLSLMTCIADFFRNPVANSALVDGEFRILVNKPLVCFNSMKLVDILANIPDGTQEIVIHFDPSVAMIDHSSYEGIRYAIEQYNQANIPVRVEGLDRLRRLSTHPASVRVAYPALAFQSLPAVS